MYEERGREGGRGQTGRGAIKSTPRKKLSLVTKKSGGLEHVAL